MLLMACTTHKHQIAKQPVPKFNNQGEQEDYWVNKFFDENYKKEEFQKYSGYVQSKHDTVRYGNGIITTGDTSVLRLVFTSGLIYPKLFNCNKLGAFNIEEKSPLNHSVKIKRFEVWVYLPTMANPTVYLFELTNEEATNNMTIAEFIKGARLTFFKQGWIIV